MEGGEETLRIYHFKLYKTKKGKSSLYQNYSDDDLSIILRTDIITLC